MKRNIAVQICFIVCYVICLSAVLSGCAIGFNKDNDMEAIKNEMSFSASDGSTAKILFYFNNWYDGKTKDQDSEIIELLEKNLWDNGIHVSFIPYYSYSPIQLGRQKYTDAIKEMSAAGTIDAFQIPKNYIEQKEPDSNLFNDVETLDLTNILSDAAPILSKTLQKSGVLTDTGQVSYIPMNATSRFESGRNTVIMREDVAKNLGVDKVQSFSDYEQILETIKFKYQYIPGYIYKLKCYDVMLEELNYYSLDGALRLDIGASLFAFRYDDKEMVRPVPIEQIPGINLQYARLCDLHRRGLLLTIGNTPYPDFSNVASFIVPIVSWMPAFDYDKSRAFLINEDKPVKKVMAIDYDRLYILKDSRSSKEIIKMLEWINSRPENMQLIRYGRVNIDYLASSNRVKPLLNGRKPENYDDITKTYDYRFRFNFLLNSSSERNSPGDATSIIPINVKTLNNLLPLEELIVDNREKSILDIMNEIKNEYKQNGINIANLINTRADSFYKAIERIPFDVNSFDDAAEKQRPGDLKIMQDYYAEIVKRIRG